METNVWTEVDVAHYFLKNIKSLRPFQNSNYVYNIQKLTKVQSIHTGRCYRFGMFNCNWLHVWSPKVSKYHQAFSKLWSGIQSANGFNDLLTFESSTISCWKWVIAWMAHSIHFRTHIPNLFPHLSINWINLFDIDFVQNFIT